MRKMVLPARAHGKRLVYEFPGCRVRGASFKIFLRNELKKVSEYHTPVELDNPGVAGRTEDGVPIPINTLGRWLFGVPSYAGNAVFDGFKDVPEVVVNVGGGVSDEVVELLDKLFSVVGGVRQE
jgi:hypothetical protein